MTFTGPADGPCEPFTTWAEITACGAVPDIDETAQDLAVEVASETVWGLLGERYTGACERTAMPCWQGRCATWIGPGWVGPGWVGSSEGCGSCSCGFRSRLDLGVLPVWGVTAVIIDDVELDNADGLAYRLEDWRYLVRTDGSSWPRCQDSWTVQYTYGTPIPARARRAASLLGLEFAKQCAGLECGLDVRTESYSREGLTVRLSAPNDLIAKGYTGIPTIDLLLGSLGGKGGGGGLFDLSDVGRSREVTWTLVDADV